MRRGGFGILGDGPVVQRIWAGGDADWYDPSQWTTPAAGPDSFPLPGDNVRVSSGRVRLIGSEAQVDHTFDDNNVRLGSSDADAPAELLARNAVLQMYFDVTATAGHFAEIASVGTSGFDGTLLVNGQLTLDARRRAGGQPGVLVLNSDAKLTVTGGGRLSLQGAVKLETTPDAAIVEGGGTLDNEAALDLAGSTLTIAPGARLTGDGTIHLGLGSTLDLGSAAPAGQTIAFDEPGALLSIRRVETFGSAITGFVRGDRIDLEDVAADGDRFNPATGLFELTSGGSVVAALRLDEPAQGTILTRPDGFGGTTLVVARSKPRVAYEIAAADRAMRSDVVRDTMTTADGTPIDGSGVKIGIISDSFDQDGSAIAAAAAGYLPYDAASGTSAVDVLQDDPHGENEGQAMAELVHQVAPGAAIDFSTGDFGLTGFAKAVDALRADGCTIIVDDLGYTQEPYFQVSGPIDDAIESAIGAGVSYFTAAGNLGNAFYEAAFDPVETALQDAPDETVTAHRFSNGTPYESVTLTGGETAVIDVPWDAAYPSGGASVPDALVLKIYDLDGNLLKTSHQLKVSGTGLPEIELSLKVPQGSPTTYQVALYHVDGTPAVGRFGMILSGFGGGSGPGGYFDDAAAEQGAGTVFGHGLVAGVNTVGAATWANSPTFGTDRFTEGFSSSGPGELLFDPDGNRLPAPVSAGKVEFVAPDGADVDTDGFRPFFGTSAAAPSAAAVAALMLQANPDLSPQQVTTLLEASASDMGLPTAQQGAGLIQADGAVSLAQGMAAPSLAVDRPSAEASGALGIGGTSDAIGQTVRIALGGAGSDLAQAIVGLDGTWSATIDPATLPAGHAVLRARVAGTGGSVAHAVFSAQATDPALGPEQGSDFVFKAHPGHVAVANFAASGAAHDTLSLSASDFSSLADVLRHTAMADGSAVIAWGAQSSVTLDGVTKQALARHAGDLSLHA